MTPKQINDALASALDYAQRTGRNPIVRIVMTWGTIIDAPSTNVVGGMLQVTDMNGALVFIDSHCVGIIAGGLAPAPDGAEIDIQEGELVTPKVTQ